MRGQSGRAWLLGALMGETGQTVSGTTEYVSSGQVTGLTVGNGATVTLLYVTSSGLVTGLAVSSGGTVSATSSGTISSVQVSSGGNVTVASGGHAITATVLNGGMIQVGVQGSLKAAGEDGDLSSVTINAGGQLNVLGGGAVYGGSVQGTLATMSVASGALVSSVVLGAGATEYVAGKDVGGTVGSSAVQSVQAGGTVLNAVISGGQQEIMAGASALNAVVEGARGKQVVDSGGYTSAALVQSGGIQTVAMGGSAFDVTVGSSGTQSVAAGATVSGTHVLSGGQQAVGVGASVYDLVIENGAEVDARGVNGSGGGGLFGVTVRSGGLLVLSDANAVVSGLVIDVGAQIDLAAFGALDSSNVTFSGDTMTISSDGTTETLVFDNSGGALQYDSFQWGMDSSYYPAVSLLTYIACYCPGTLIATRTGEVPVEQLQVGDMVCTASGGMRRIRWIGRRSYAEEFVARNPALLPVRIRAHALGENMPRRDLLVSPSHAMFIEKVLVPASALVNGRSILKLTSPQSVDYIHIELDQHDLLLAEGTPSESYVEDGSRNIFQNVDDYYSRYPAARPVPPVYCAPRVERGERLTEIWQRLSERAAALDVGTAVPADGTVSSDAGLCGWLDHADRRKVTGWVWDEAHPWERAKVDVIIDNEVVATVTANTYRGDIPGKCGGWVGFEHVLPEPLACGRSHRVEVRHAGRRKALSGSPRTIEAGGRFDRDMEVLVEQAVALLETSGKREQVLSFMSRQMERIRQQEADEGAGRDEREGVEAARRLAGRAAHGMMPARRVLVIDEMFPRRGRDAGTEAILSHLRSLRRLGYEVTFVSVQRDVTPEAMAALEGEGVRVAGAPFYSSPEDVLRRQAGAFDVVYFHRASVASSYAGLARRYMQRARLIYSLADLHYLRLGRQAQVEGRIDLARSVGRIRTIEMTAAMLCDVVITHSSFEACELRRLMPNLNVHVVPWDVAAYPVTVPASARSGIAFLANYGHAPNVDAVHWLFKEIMPRVWKDAPHIRLTLAGQGMSELVRALARPATEECGGIEILGPVADLRSGLFEKVRLGISPLRFGAGVKGKVLDTFAAGVACVMTPVAAEGMNLPARLRGLVAEGSDELAATLIRLHAAPETADELGRTGLRMIETEFGKAAVDRALGQALGHDLARQQTEDRQFA